MRISDWSSDVCSSDLRAQGALADARRFDEFNRRFAFILHDIKNLVSQLSLVARNAERHADNPDFRADLIATLQESAGRMNEERTSVRYGKSVSVRVDSVARCTIKKKQYTT